jgi:hypothetical protein
MARILIADHEPQVREMLEETLEELMDQGVELILRVTEWKLWRRSDNTGRNWSSLMF